MFIRISLIILAIVFSRCTQQRKLNKVKLEAINLSVKWEFINVETAGINNFTADVDIIYWDSLVMFRNRIPYLEFGKRTSYESNDTVYTIQELVDDSTDARTSYWFFVYKEGDISGIRYDSINAMQGTSFNVDSLLKVKALKSGVFYTSNDSLVETTKQIEGYSMLRKYVPKIRYDDTYGDSSHRYFSDKLNGIKYSFSPLLDSLEKMKLCKVIFVYNPIPKGKYDKDLPGRKMLFEIKRIEIENPEKIIALFERFKRDMSKK